MKAPPFKTTLLGVLLLGAVLGTTPASAQDGVSLRVVPRFGMLFPDAYLYEEYAHFGAGNTEWTTTSLRRAGFGGIALELGLGRGLRVRAEALRSFRGWALADHVVTVPDTAAGTTTFQTTWYDLPYRLSEAGLQLLLPLRITHWGVRPYVLAGGVARWYHFGASTRPTATYTALPPDAVYGGALVGAGLRFSLLGIGVDLQGREALGHYADKSQHDAVLSAGVVWRVF
ncbi:MAG: hypothetical protein P8099_10420 [Gemmatimonadota bacterium]|jgi:hypothetical protein